MTHVTASLDQDSFRGRNDDGSQSGASWKATTNTNWTQAVDENFRVRFLVQETAGGSVNNANLQLQYNLNGTGWNSVNGTSSVVQSALSANFADDDNTTQQIGAGTFISPNSGMDENNGLAGENNDIDFDGNDEVEVEYCCQVLSGDVADTDTVQLRVVRADLTVLESYTNTPSITVSEDSSITGSGTLGSGASDISGSGAQTHTGSGTISAGASSLSGAGSQVHDGSGTLVSAASSVSGTGTQEVSGSGTLTPSASTVSGTGSVETDDISGGGTLVSGDSSISGTGSQTIIVSGTLVAQSSSLSGSGIQTISGYGSLSSDPSTISGSGSIPSSGPSIRAIVSPSITTWMSTGTVQ